jgi:hypothetical protein
MALHQNFIPLRSMQSGELSVRAASGSNKR